jgi:hypothetical protein
VLLLSLLLSLGHQDQDHPIVKLFTIQLLRLMTFIIILCHHQQTTLALIQSKNNNYHHHQ